MSAIQERKSQEINTPCRAPRAGWSSENVHRRHHEQQWDTQGEDRDQQDERYLTRREKDRGIQQRAEASEPNHATR